MSESLTKPRAKFHSMDEGTKADWDIIATEAMYAAVGLPDRVLVVPRRSSLNVAHAATLAS